MSEISPEGEAHHGFPVVRLSYRDTHPEGFLELRRLLIPFVPGGLEKPLPDDPGLLRDILDESKRFIRSAEEWMSDRHGLEVAVHHGLGEEDIRVRYVRLEKILPQVPILALGYAPWTRDEMLFFGYYLLRTRSSSEHPSVEEVLADEGLAETIEWFLDLTKLVHREVFRKLETPTPPPTEGNPAMRQEIEVLDPVGELRKRGRPTRTRLVEFMRDRDHADFEDLAHDVHGDQEVSDGAIERNIERTNESLIDMGIPLRFRVSSSRVFKETPPD